MPVVERNVLKARCPDHFQEDQISVAGILDMVAERLWNIADVAGAEIDRARGEWLKNTVIRALPWI